MPERNSAVMVVMDTSRARELALGWPTPSVTPFLRDLSGQSLVWKHAVAPAIWTPPAHASLFSGLMPSQHRVIGHRLGVKGGWKHEISRIQDRWLPSVLNREGVETFGISANPFISSATGFDRGFQRWNQVRAVQGKRSRPARTRLGRKLGKLRWAAGTLARPPDRGGEEVLELLEYRLNEVRDRQFFGFVNLMEAHSPFWTPFARRIPVRRRVRGLSLMPPLYTMRRNRFNGLWSDSPGDWLGTVQEFYVSALQYLDQLVERIGDLLDRLGLRESTLLAIVSDHGEHLGEHHLLGHVLSLYEEVLHVPALVCGPVDSGVIEDSASAMVVRRLIMERAGSPDPDPLPFPAAEFESMKLAHPSFKSRVPRPLLESPGIALYDGEWKLWADREGFERFFRVGDLGEVQVSLVPPVPRERLLSRRDAWLLTLPMEPVPPESSDKDGDASAGEDEEMAAHLKELGYLD